MLLALVPCFAVPAQPEDQLPLTTARAVHQLTPLEASRARPVHLSAVVLFYDLYLDKSGKPVLFVGDASGSTYVSLKSKPAVPLAPGDLVDLTGVTDAGLLTPIVAKAQARVVGTAPLPAQAPRVSLGDMLTSSVDGQWAEVAGLVHSVSQTGPLVFLDLSLKYGMVTAVTERQPGVDYSGLLDSGIVVRGVVSPNFNHLRQVPGAHLLFPNLSTLKIIEAGSADPFTQPVEPISNLLRFNYSKTFQHRIHIRGAVTLLWPGRMICIKDIKDGSNSLCATTQQTAALREGELADVIGFPTTGEFTPTLVEAQYRSAGPHPAPAPIAPVPITVAQAMDGDHDAQLVSIEARIIDRSLGSSDRTLGPSDRSLTLSSGGMVFTATLPREFIPASAKLQPIGSIVRLTGICLLQSAGTSAGLGEGYAVPVSFHILQRSLSDVVLVQKPSWWSPEHSLYVLIVALALIALALGAIAFLNHRIHQQTATIRAQLTETAALKTAAEFQAMHDSLTGLFNRKAIFDALHREFTADSGATTGVVMLDIDHFKRINDTHGHVAGDSVLKETVRRMLLAVRSTDLIGRYGGEEFLIVLPNCDRNQAEVCAERIRAAIAAEPVKADVTPIQVTASLGAVIVEAPVEREQDHLSRADRALYEAKHNGRNRVVFHDLDAPQTSAQGFICLP